MDAKWVLVAFPVDEASDPHDASDDAIEAVWGICAQHVAEGAMVYAGVRDGAPEWLTASSAHEAASRPDEPSGPR